MNSYFEFWNIVEPVFLSRSNLYVEIDPFKPIKKRLLMQLQIGMKLQLLLGKPGSGKTRMIQAVANNLEVSEWDCLYCLVSSQTFETSSLTKRIMRFLDTSVDSTNQTNPKNLITRLEKIGKSKRKILILLDFIDSLENNTSLTGELNTLVDLCIRHNLPMHFIATESNADENSVEKRGPLYQKLISKANSICHLPEINTEEFAKFVGQYLSASHLPENLIPSDIVEKILEYADKDLKKSTMLLESLLIDCHIENDRKIRTKNLNRILKQSTLPGATIQIRTSSEEKRSEESKHENNQPEGKLLYQNNELETKTSNSEEKETSIYTKTSFEAPGNENGLKITHDWDNSESQNEDLLIGVNDIQTGIKVKTTDPIGVESPGSSEQKTEHHNVDLSETREGEISKKTLKSQFPESETEHIANARIPPSESVEPNQYKNTMQKTLANLKNLEGKPDPEHNQQARSAVADKEDFATTKRLTQNGNEKNASRLDQAETRRQSSQKRPKHNERKASQKTEWNVPKISLSQLTKKA